MTNSPRRLWTITMSLASILAATAAAQPPTAKRPVTDTYHGVSVSDPYRWLEDDKAAEVREWSEAQNGYARGILDKLPGVETIRARVTEIMSKRSPSYGDVKFRWPQSPVNRDQDMRSIRYFASKNQPPKQQPMIVVLYVAR